MRKVIGIISDTHGLLRPQVLDNLRDCEAILHGGDINSQQILDELNKIAPVYAVRGNNDKEWAEHLPEFIKPELFGIRFFMIHNKKMISEDLSDRDIIIFGHSHKYEEKQVGRQLWLNPGSCGPRRFAQPITMALLEVEDDGSFCVHKIDIPHEISRGADSKRQKMQKGQEQSGQQIQNQSNQQLQQENVERIPANIRQIIDSVMKDTNRNRSVPEIAKRNGISQALAEQICRLYVTHPGVDADGIMRKMGL